MFLKALVISIILHFLVLIWAGFILPFSPSQQQMGPTPSTQSRQIITLVEPPITNPKPQPAASKKELPVETKLPEKNSRISLKPPESKLEEKPLSASTLTKETELISPPTETELSPELPQEENGNTIPALSGGPEKGMEQEKSTVPTSLELESQKAAGLLTNNQENPVISTVPEPKADPVKISHIDPVYPRKARRNGWEGTVFLQALINKKGEVAEAFVTTSSGFELLDQTALKAVKQWQYQWPAQLGSLNEKLISIKIIFKLEE